MTAVGPHGGVYHRGGTWAGHPYGGYGYHGGYYHGGYGYGYRPYGYVARRRSAQRPSVQRLSRLIAGSIPTAFESVIKSCTRPTPYAEIADVAADLDAFRSTRSSSNGAGRCAVGGRATATSSEGGEDEPMSDEAGAIPKFKAI